MDNFITLNELPDFLPLEGLKAKLVHTNTQTFAFWEIQKGAILPAHAHHHEQASIVTEGELELTIGEEKRLMTKGMIAIIPSNITHSAIAKTKVSVTDIFLPVREDFK